MYRKLIAAGAGVVAAAVAILPVHGEFGCGTGPIVASAWGIPWTTWGICGMSLGQWMYGLGMILPSWGMPWSWW